MPNHVTSRMRVSGPDAIVRRFKQDYITVKDTDPSERRLDFERVIPMPPDLRAAQSGILSEMAFVAWYGEDKDLERYLSYPWIKEAGVAGRAGLQNFLLRRDPQNKAQADLYKRNIERYGAPTWYEWAIAHWGTKWNSYDLEIVKEGDGWIEVTFLTAWSPPEPVLLALSRVLPELEFDVKSYDEGGGFACEGAFMGGESTYECKDATERLRRLVYEGTGIKDWEPGKGAKKKRKRR